jgi:hypothetical protein
VRAARSIVSGLLALCVAQALPAEEGAPAPDAAPPPAAETGPVRQPIPGTSVSLEVPAGFAVSEDFPGIGHPGDLSSVMVTELAVPLEIASETFAPAALERQGLEPLREESVEVDGRSAKLVHARQKIGGMSFRKWFLVLGDETRSVLLTATTPSESEEVYGEALVRALRSARRGAASPAPPGASLPFRVREAPPLRIVRSAEGSVVLSEAQAVAGHVTPVVTVGASQARVAIDDLPAFARERLEQTGTIYEIAVRSQQPRTLGGLPAHQIAARALDTESGRPVEVRQVLGHDAARYYLVQGIFDAEDAARLAPAFDAVAASFELARAPTVR